MLCGHVGGQESSLWYDWDVSLSVIFLRGAIFHAFCTRVDFTKIRIAKFCPPTLQNCHPHFSHPYFELKYYTGYIYMLYILDDNFGEWVESAGVGGGHG